MEGWCRCGLGIGFVGGGWRRWWGESPVIMSVGVELAGAERC